MINFLDCLLFPLDCKPKKKRKMTELEKYILSHNPESLEQVEWLQKRYTNSQGQYNDHLYR